MAKLLNDDRTRPIYASTRFSDVLAYAEGKDFLRVLFDDEKHLFLYCNGWDYIHIFLGKAAIDCGLYPTSLYSKLTKNLGLFEFTVSTKYRKELLTQDSYSSVKEYNGFFIYTREGSELLKNPVFKEIVKPYIKKKEITIEERIRRLEKKLFERENLSKFNRIAGFYSLRDKKFNLFPRTTEDISPEDDEINDYIHNVTDKDELTEFKIVRFGIEDIKGEGVVCYIEADTKRHAEECYYAIIDEYQEDCDIIKYELEFYVGKEHKYLYFDRYGQQIMENA